MPKKTFEQLNRELDRAWNAWRANDTLHCQLEGKFDRAWKAVQEANRELDVIIGPTPITKRLRGRLGEQTAKRRKK
jgi:hypothetical protein